MIRIDLMTDPIVVVSSRGERKLRRKTSERLLRLLVWCEAPLDQGEVLRDLAEGDLGAKTSDIQYLLTEVRDCLGPKGDPERARLETVTHAADGTRYDRAHYRLDVTGIELDVDHFEEIAETAETALKEYEGDLDSAPQKVPIGFSASLENWTTAFQSFGVNPGIANSTYTPAVTAFDRFETLRQSLLTGLVVAHASRFMQEGNSTDLNRALAYITSFDDVLSDDLWRLRFRLAGSSESWKLQLPNLQAEYRNAEGELPADLLRIVDGINRRDDEALLVPKLPPQAPIRSSRPSPSASPAQFENTELGRAVTGLGITEHTSLQLEDSNISPVQCCRQVVRRLWFSGIMANKWVLDPDAHTAFDRLLTRLDREEEFALARLMIVNPESEAAEVLRDRGLLTDREMKSIPVLQDLVLAHPSFEVRMYDALPLFRLIIVDQTFVTVGPYLNQPAALPRSGWEVPQLALTHAAPYPLAQSFVGLFEESWKRYRNAGLPLR